LLQQAIALDSGLRHGVAQARGRAEQHARQSGAQIVAATTKAYHHRDRLPEVEKQFTIAYYYDNVEIDPAKVRRPTVACWP
jgi:hypothetical protein